MKPQPSKELLDIAPPKVPDEVMKQVHDANVELSAGREALNESIESTEFEHGETLKQATDQVKDAEKHVEDAEQKVRDIIDKPRP